MKQGLFSFLVFTALLLPVAASAQSIFWNFKEPILTCTANDPSKLPPGEGAPQKQCQNFCDLLATGQNVLKVGLTIALLVIAPIMFLLGGILMIISRGNKEQYTAGVKTITGAAMGAALILVSFVIVNTFFYFAGLRSGGPVSTSTWFKIQCTVPPA